MIFCYFGCGLAITLLAALLLSQWPVYAYTTLPRNGMDRSVTRAYVYEISATHGYGVDRWMAGLERTLREVPRFPAPELIPFPVKVPQTRAKDEYWATTWTFGLPMRSMYSAAIEPAGQMVDGVGKDGIITLNQCVCLVKYQNLTRANPLPFDKKMSGCFPTCIIWRGTLINALAYGSMCFCFKVVFAWWRNRKRKHPNQCASCGYLMEGIKTSTCPECGSEHK